MIDYLWALLPVAFVAAPILSNLRVKSTPAPAKEQP